MRGRADRTLTGSFSESHGPFGTTQRRAAQRDAAYSRAEPDHLRPVRRRPMPLPSHLRRKSRRTSRPPSDTSSKVSGAEPSTASPRAAATTCPRDAIAGIECDSDEPAVARIGFYLFGNDTDMLDAYFFRMNAEGVTRDSGTCYEGEGEGAYTPGEEDIPSRIGCFINGDGFANLRATLPGAHVYIGVLGRSGDTRALDAFAWRFNQDVPGQPTLWGEPS